MAGRGLKCHNQIILMGHTNLMPIDPDVQGKEFFSFVICGTVARVVCPALFYVFFLEKNNFCTKIVMK